MYFTDRLYSNEELPNDYKVKVSEEGKTAPSINIVMADKSLLMPAESGDQVHDLDKPRPGTGLPPTAAGQDLVRGLESILNSVEKEPLKLWKKEVSVYKTINSLEPASLVVVHQTFPTINIFFYSLLIILLNHNLV